MKNYFSIEDVRLLPELRKAKSRDLCDTTVKFGDFTFKLPVVPSNMMCSMSQDLAIELAKNGYFYIMHRFKHNNIDFVRKMNELNLLTSISVGETQESYDQLSKIKEQNLKIDFICIDVAHGHSETVTDMASFIRLNFPNTFIIGGNVCTTEGVEFLETVCDAVKIDIGSGSACTTFHTTQFGSRGWNGRMLLECTKIAKKPIILDGGIKTIGNMVAAYSLGASMVMVGGLMAGFKDSPGEQVTGTDGNTYKEFFGSASEFTKGHKKYVEGKKYLIPMKNINLLDFYNEIEFGFRSAISYAGGLTLNELQNCKFIVVD